MTFRTRLVLAAAAAAVAAVLLGTAASFVVAKHSLVGSVDVSLAQQARGLIADGYIENTCGSTAGYCTQIVFADGTTIPGRQVVPISKRVQRAAASRGAAPMTYFSTDADGAEVREVVYPLGPGYKHAASPKLLYQGGAFQVTLPLTGVNQELRALAFDLWLIVIIGVALATFLGLLVGRTVLAPLNELTDTVEDLAETTDVSRRLDPGGPDELGRLRRAFNSLLVALDRSRESQRQLVLDASHELRTPLTSLRTNMEVARRMEDLDVEDRDVLIGDVLTQLDELTSLVADLAELARGEQPSNEARPFRFDELVSAAVVAATTHGRSRRVTYTAQLEPCWVSGSSHRIERAVDNLLDNALKWSPDDAVVEVHLRNGELFVRDHGPGVAESDMPHIFDRFYRAADARSRPGSGLGLAIVAQVVRDENGEVSVHQAEGGGALFRLRLPVIDPPADDSSYDD
jgi:two-component system sensor histidine kinase MprB